MTVTTIGKPAVVDTEVIKLLPWADEDSDMFGHDPRSAYVEQFWLGTLGPTTTWFLRHCVHLLESSETAAIDVKDAALRLGIGHQGGIRSAMGRTVARACRFRAARPVGTTTLAVRLRLPNVSPRQLQRMPESVRRLHEQYLSAEGGTEVISKQRRRARRIAISLIECGDEQDEAELHLGRLQFHPAVAADAVRWAWSQHRIQLVTGPPEAS